jgi:hypothetical protein
MRDVNGWDNGTAGVELLEQVEDGDVYKHYVRQTES